MESKLPLLLFIVIVVMIVLIFTEKKLFERLEKTSMPLAMWGIMFFLGGAVTLVVFASFLETNPFVDTLFLFLVVAFSMTGGTILKNAANKWVAKRFLQKGNEKEGKK